jgi:hypothetical protein
LFECKKLDEIAWMKQADSWDGLTRKKLFPDVGVVLKINTGEIRADCNNF